MVPLRTLPGLSKLSQEIIFNDEDVDMTPALSKLCNIDGLSLNAARHPRTSSSPDRSATHSLAYKVAFDHQDQEANEPLLLPDKPRTGLRPFYLPLKRQSSLDRIVIAPDQNHTPQLDSEKPLPRRHPYIPSDVAHCSMTPSRSPASSKSNSPPISASPFYHFRKVRKHPFADGYEVPQWRLLIIHLGLCALAYPFLLVFVIASRGTTLFWARVFVSVGCGAVGVLLGLSLINLARAIMEAASKSHA